jgi:hypothetical protein
MLTSLLNIEIVLDTTSVTSSASNAVLNNLFLNAETTLSTLNTVLTTTSSILDVTETISTTATSSLAQVTQVNTYLDEVINGEEKGVSVTNNLLHPALNVIVEV